MNRYAPLLIALFGFLILQPIAVTLSGANIPLNILTYILMTTVIYALWPHKWLTAVAFAMAVAIVMTRLLNEARPSPMLVILGHGLSFVLMSLLAVTIIIEVFNARKVTAEIIVGAVCVYLVMGVAWTYLFYFLQAAAPGSMMAVPIAASATQIPVQLEQYRFWEMLYFSMSALSTMGFLSTEPLTPLARQLAVVEAIMGQLYVAVLIARLVALSTAGAMKTGSGAE